MSTPDWYEPLIMPGILTFFGVLICWMGWMAEKAGKTANWKWLGILLLIGGMWFGYTNSFSHMIGQSPEDKLYRDNLPTVHRYAYAHYASFFLPLFALIGCIILQFVKKPSATQSPAPDQ